MSQKAGSTIRIDDDIAEDVRVKLVREKTSLARLVNAYLRDWVGGAATTRTGVEPDIDMRKAVAHAAKKSADLTRALEELATLDSSHSLPHNSGHRGDKDARR